MKPKCAKNPLAGDRAIARVNSVPARVKRTTVIPFARIAGFSRETRRATSSLGDAGIGNRPLPACKVRLVPRHGSAFLIDFRLVPEGGARKQNRTRQDFSGQSLAVGLVRDK